MEQWHPLTKLLHWLMAVLLFAMLGLGFMMTRLAKQAFDLGDFSMTLFGLSIFDAYQLHKSMGVILFIAVVVRLAIRSVTTAAIHPELTPIERALARLVHGVLYGLMLALPLSGWMLASASPLGLPTVVFGLVRLPNVVHPSEMAEQVWSWVHFAGGLMLVIVAATHILAALKHHYWNQDSVLTSMWPIQRQSRRRKIR